MQLPELREQPDLQHLVLIALAGYGQSTDRQRADSVGFHHRLVKPVDPQALERILAPAVP